MEFVAGLTLPPEVGVYVYAAIAVVARMTALLYLMPAIGELSVSPRIRVALIVGISLALVPMVVPMQLPAVSRVDLIALLIFESLIGLTLGVAFRLLVLALSVAGTIISQSMSLTQLLGGGVMAEPNPSVSMLLVMMGAALFVTLDLHTQAIGLLYESYVVFPLAEVPDTGALAKYVTERVSSAFALAVSLALPFILIGFLYNLVLGLMNQAMPQMMVTFIGVPANVLAGLVILGLAIVSIMYAWLDTLDEPFRGFW